MDTRISRGCVDSRTESKIFVGLMSLLFSLDRSAALASFPPKIRCLVTVGFDAALSGTCPLVETRMWGSCVGLKVASRGSVALICLSLSVDEADLASVSGLVQQHKNRWISVRVIIGAYLTKCWV